MTTLDVQSLLDSLPVYAALLDNSGLVLSINGLMRDSFGPSERNADSTNLRKLHFWDLPWFEHDEITRENLRQRVLNALEGTPENFDLQYQRVLNGQRQKGWIEVSLKPNVNRSESSNAQAAITATAVDRTHREALREEVAQSQKAVELERAKLKLMFDQVAVPITMLEGPDHLCTYQNRSHRELFYGGESVVGLTVAQASPEAIDQGFIHLLDQVFRTGERYTGVEVPLSLHLKSGTKQDFFVNLTFEPSRNSRGE
ncbi:MAG: hypothetical protein EOP05_14960, partial [Proteobacteria bacterium]